MKRHVWLLGCLSGCWLSIDEVGDRVDAYVDPVSDDPRDTVDDTQVSDTELDTELPVIETDTPDDPPVTGPFVCVDETPVWDVGDPLASGQLSGGDDNFHGWCGSVAGSEDRVVRWTAQADGCYIFDTSNSSFDTVLTLHDDCDALAFACNDDTSPGDGHSEIHRKLNDGTELIAVVDGYDAGASGSWVLNVADGDELAFEQTVAGTTGFIGSFSNLLEDETLSPACNGTDTTADVVLKWIAPRNGRYTFALRNTSFNAVLSVHRQCRLRPMACVNDSGADGDESVSLPAYDGEVFIVRIAGLNDIFAPFEIYGDADLYIEEE